MHATPAQGDWCVVLLNVLRRAQGGTMRGWLEGTTDLSAVTAARWDAGGHGALYTLYLDPSLTSLFATIAPDCSLHENRTTGILRGLLGPTEQDLDLSHLAWNCDEARARALPDVTTLNLKLFCTSHQVRAPPAQACMRHPTTRGWKTLASWHGALCGGRYMSAAVPAQAAAPGGASAQADAAVVATRRGRAAALRRRCLLPRPGGLLQLQWHGQMLCAHAAPRRPALCCAVLCCAARALWQLRHLERLRQQCHCLQPPALLPGHLRQQGLVAHHRPHACAGTAGGLHAAGAVRQRV